MFIKDKTKVVCGMSGSLAALDRGRGSTGGLWWVERSNDGRISLLQHCQWLV